MSKSEFGAVAAFAFATALAIASTAAAAGVSGSNEKNLMTRTVTYTDADLRTVAGAEGLALRTRQAAAYVCGRDNVLLLTSTGYRLCMKDAVDRAIAGLNAPLLREALHRPVVEMAHR